VLEARDSDEAQQLADARAGDRGAFDRLVARHAPRLIGLAARMLGEKSDAEDAVQDALASAWLALHRFDLDKPAGPWLATITINKCRDAMRRRRLARLLSFAADQRADDIIDLSPDQEQQLAERQLLARVRREIARLPPKLKEPFVLVVFDDRSQEEAARILGISRKSVETRIYRARNFLREKFEIF